MRKVWLRPILSFCLFTVFLFPLRSHGNRNEIDKAFRRAFTTTFLAVGAAFAVTGVGITLTVALKQAAVPARAYDEAALWLASDGAEPMPVLLRSLIAAIREGLREEESRRLSDREIVMRLLQTNPI